MPQENVEIVQRGLVAYNAEDVSAFADLTTADFEWYPATTGAVERHSYQGREGIETYFREISDTWQAWERQTADPERVIDLGDTIVVLVVNRFLGRDGIELEQPGGNVITLQDGKIVRWAAYWTPESALKAVGLEE